MIDLVDDRGADAGDAWYDQHLRTSRLVEALQDSRWKVIASMRRYTEFADGRYLLEAFEALQRHDRLSSPRLHRRLGYSPRSELLIETQVRDRIYRATARVATSILAVDRMSNAADMDAIRSALQMRGAERTPKSSGARSLHDASNRVVVAQLRTKVRLQRRALAAGKSLRSSTPNATALFKAVGQALDRSFDVVRKAWLVFIKLPENENFRDLYDEFVRNSEELDRFRQAAPLAPTLAAKARTADRSNMKRAIDKGFRR